MVLMRSNILLLLFCFFFYLAPQYAVAEELNSDSLTIVDLKELGIQFAGNNKIQLITSGAEKFELMFDEIQKAQKYVYLEYFNFRNDSIGNVLFDLLCKKVNEGVVVRIIFDDWGNRSNDQPLKKEHIQRLRDAGIEIHKFDPLVFPWINHAFHRDHRKIVIIDGLVLYTGGMNVADYYIHGKPEFGKWRDMHMRLEGDAVSLYRNIFLKMWDRCSNVSIDSLEYIAHGDSVDRIVEDDTTAIYVGVANREPRISPKAIRRSYVSAIDNAQRRIQIVNPYFILTRSVKKALYRALKRGVKLEVMLSTKCDVPVTPDVSAYNAKRLMKRGADIYYYEDGFHHSKVMMIDSLFCTLGSANMNSRSIKYDYEVNAYIFDETVTNELQSIFESDKQKSTLLTPDNWKKRRSFKRRFMGWLYHFLAPLI
jgi:cardiolipin synthase